MDLAEQFAEMLPSIEQALVEAEETGAGRGYAAQMMKLLRAVQAVVPPNEAPVDLDS